jgi:benzoate 4-monooxygenase
VYPSTSCAIIHYLAQNPAAQSKLQAELDEALGHEVDQIAPWAVVKSLPYLDGVINEGLRLYCPFSMGLPRVTPEGGLYVSGKFFTEGTVLSIPIYTIHRDPEIWGDDAEAFRPERWLEMDQAKIQEIFYPFSHGPRSVEVRNRSHAQINLTKLPPWIIEGVWRGTSR